MGAHDWSLVLAGLTALGAGVADFAAARAARRTSVLAVAAMVQVGGLLLLMVALPLDNGQLQSGDIAASLTAGVLIAIGIAALYRSLAIGPMGTTAPVAAVVGAGLPVLVTFFRGLPPGNLQIVGLMLGLIAVALVASAPATGPRSRRGGKGLPLAVLGGLGIGGFSVAIESTSAVSGLQPMVIARSVAAILLLAILARQAPVLASLRKSRLSLVIGLVDGAAMLAFLYALRLGNLAFVALIAAFYPAFTVALASVIDRETLRAQHVAGMLIALASIGFISWR